VAEADMADVALLDAVVWALRLRPGQHRFGVTHRFLEKRVAWVE
jgi:hypothetical protein